MYLIKFQQCKVRFDPKKMIDIKDYLVQIQTCVYMVFERVKLLQKNIYLSTAELVVDIRRLRAPIIYPQMT